MLTSELKDDISHIRYATDVNIQHELFSDLSQRAKRNTNPNTSLIQIEGVSSKEDARFVISFPLAVRGLTKKIDSIPESTSHL